MRKCPIFAEIPLALPWEILHIRSAYAVACQSMEKLPRETHVQLHPKPVASPKPRALAAFSRLPPWYNCPALRFRAQNPTRSDAKNLSFFTLCAFAVVLPSNWRHSLPRYEMVHPNAGSPHPTF